MARDLFMASIVTQSDQNGPKWVQNGPKWVQSVQNGSKMGSKRVPKGVQKGSKGGGVPKWVPQRSEPKKISKNIFSLALLWGVIQGAPPLKNTILGRYQPLRPCSRRIQEKSAVPPPADGPAGGISPLFFQISATTWSKWLVPY